MISKRPPPKHEHISLPKKKGDIYYVTLLGPFSFIRHGQKKIKEKDNTKMAE